MQRLAIWVVLLAVGLLSFAVREVNHLRGRPLPGDGDGHAWFSSDPDGLYHMRRVERSLSEGLPVAVRDPYLAYPQGDEAGGPIPWPPYYTLVLHSLVRPFAPADAILRKGFVERSVATWPAIFSALTSMIVVLAAARLAQRAGEGAQWMAGLVAGISHALAFGSLRYAFVGNGDHHAWVSMLYAILLLGGSLSLRRSALEDAPRSTLAGTLCGVVVGLSIGSWVAALELLALFDLALLGIWLFGGPSLTRGLAAFGATLHGAALMVLLPAAFGSPWALTTPTSLVNLTSVHLLLLACGFAFFACTPLRAAVRRAPWLAALLPFAILYLVLRSPLAEPLWEAFTWARGSGSFMAFTNESRPLVNSAEGALPLFDSLGFSLPLAVIAWLFAVRATVRGATEWTPWIVAFPILLLQCSMNRRFADLLLPVQVVLLGWGASRLCMALAPRWRRTALVLACVGAALAHPSTLRMTRQRLASRERLETASLARERGERELLAWLKRATPEPGSPPGYSVLAQWDLGHGIVWAAERPVVATNFGSYLGLASYLDPWRFFLERSELAGAQILAEHRSRYVVLTSRFRRNLDAMVRVLKGDAIDEWLRGSEQRGALWMEGLGARMWAQMGGPIPRSENGADLGGLATFRMIYVSPDRHRDHERVGAFGPSPVGAVFEHVPGARVLAHGEPGEVLRGSLRLGFPGVERERVWRAAATVDANGIAELRVPYATTLGEDGERPTVGNLRWSIAERRGETNVEEAAVVGGLEVLLTGD